MVTFPVVVPEALGEPDRVTVTPDRRMVTMEWSSATGGLIRLDQIGGSLSPYYVKKYYDDVTFTMVDGDEALWFARSHPIVVLNRTARNGPSPPRGGSDPAVAAPGGDAATGGNRRSASRGVDRGVGSRLIRGTEQSAAV